MSCTRVVGYIEPLLSFALHVPVRKRPVLRAEENTRPIAMEEKIAKLAVIMVIAQMK